jgi:hypothetical protein
VIGRLVVPDRERPDPVMLASIGLLEPAAFPLEGGPNALFEFVGDLRRIAVARPRTDDILGG